MKLLVPNTKELKMLNTADLARQLLKSDRLNPWEREFLISVPEKIEKFETLTPKQLEVFVIIQSKASAAPVNKDALISEAMTLSMVIGTANASGFDESVFRKAIIAWHNDEGTTALEPFRDQYKGESNAWLSNSRLKIHSGGKPVNVDMFFGPEARTIKLV